MAIHNKNTNFRLGLSRTELIEASLMFGKKLSTAKKDSTKRLEEYVTNKLGGRGTKVPTFTEMQKRDIKDASSTFGLNDAIDLVRYRIEKITGKSDESNYLRLTIRRSFSAFYDGILTNEMVDELISRMEHLDYYQMLSGMYTMQSHIVNLFSEYSEELEQKKINKM